jgi:hypothetical protein
MKKTVKTAQNIGVEEYKCKVELDKKDKKELIIWTRSTSCSISGASKTRGLARNTNSCTQISSIGAVLNTL